ncbi:DUF192 domain-containing protein [Patulibacter sp. NPDC049589]|uniref:DUF192 domain-containing protein n=1 Tax=Patulibacter sp. NPDC049589 TaxID=3154731 RepID=UPI00344AF01B
MTATRAASWPVGWAIHEATSRRARGRGLLGRRALSAREGLWLPVRSIHTIGMRFALDLVWLGGDGRVVRVDEHVLPGRLRTCLRARGGVVEIAAGSGAPLTLALRAGPAAYFSSGSRSSERERVAR